MDPSIETRLRALHHELERCKSCPSMQGPVVHGPPLASKILLVGQAPGPHEGGIGRPFAWTAGKTMFRWFEAALGISETAFREQIYMTAVARCFPGKAAGGGDRKPNAVEIATCGRFLAQEVEILRPDLIIPVGTLATFQVLGRKAPLVETIGHVFAADWHGHAADAIPLPHPSGASPWHKLEPGKTLLSQALALIAQHPAVVKAFR